MNLKEHIKILKLNGVYRGEEYIEDAEGIYFNKMNDKYAGEFIVQPFVNRISLNAFKNCKEITKITVLSDIKRVEMYAFENCNKLKHVEFMGNIRYLGPAAFARTPIQSFIAHGTIGHLDEQFHIIDFRGDSPNHLSNTLKILNIQNVKSMVPILAGNLSNIPNITFGRSLEPFIKGLAAYEEIKINWID